MIAITNLLQFRRCDLRGSVVIITHAGVERAVGAAQVRSICR
ncbi:MAG: hypothetical protein ACXQTG_02495 [Methanoculleaceae archaeon]